MTYLPVDGLTGVGQVLEMLTHLKSKEFLGLKSKQMQIRPLQEVQQYDIDEEFYTLKFSIARELE